MNERNMPGPRSPFAPTPDQIWSGTPRSKYWRTKAPYFGILKRLAKNWNELNKELDDRRALLTRISMEENPDQTKLEVIRLQIRELHDKIKEAKKSYLDFWFNGLRQNARNKARMLGQSPPKEILP